ncbi:MAG: methionyl-tRNA formyltransferase [Candidatus Limnocylindrales bacterium]
MTAERIRTVFIGSGGFGRESLQRLALQAEVVLVGVITAPARRAGRTKQMLMTPIANDATSLGIGTILTPERLRALDVVADVLALEPELVVLADYGQIVPSPLLELRLGALNLHPSLLPRHRGATPIPAAILAGDTETGVTLMRMDAGLDTGPIVAQVRVALHGAESTPGLESMLALEAADLLDRHLGPWTRGELSARPQPTEGATLTRPLRREDGRLDPARSAVDLGRQVRAYQPWPGSFVDTISGRVIVWSAAPVAADGPANGTFDHRGLGAGGGSWLAFGEVQPAGGPRMSWEAMLRGRPSLIGSRIVPGDPGIVR